MTAVLTVLTNYIFIKAFGITGAAMATALTIILINVFIQAFLYRHYHMHPFSVNMLKVAITGALCLGVNYFIPVIHYHYIFDILVRSSVITILFLGLAIGLRLAPDYADYFWKMVGMIWKRR